MGRITIVHKTEYTYHRPVGLLRHRLMLRPDDSHDLRLHRSDLRVEPKPSRIEWKHDAFDNSICFLDWPEDLRTDHLQIVSTVDLTHHPDGPPRPVYILDQAARSFPFTYADEDIPDLVSLRQVHTADPERVVQTWAQGFLAGCADRSTLAVLEAMTRTIKTDFTYGARYEEGTQTAVQTITLGSGTCRDFAVLMMEALRSFGIATRFVTGYLYDDLSGTTRGGGSTHAWCGVFVPGAGWIEYDPTNGLVAGSNLVRVGVTRAASQALPVSGGFIGSADDPAGLFVDVSITGAPV